MGRSRRQDWTLFIDESGPWAKPNKDFGVFGVLIRDGVPELSPASLRQTMDQALPHLPWPWHAAHINQPLSAFFWHQAARRAPKRVSWSAIADSSVAAHVEVIHDALTRHPSMSVQDIIDGAVDDPRLNIENLKRLTLFLGQDPSPEVRRSLRALQSLARLHRDIITELFRRLSRFTNGPGPGVMFMAAGEGWRSEATSASPDRYQGLLGVLLQRTANILALLPGKHRVEVSPLTLHINEPLLNRKVPLHQRHVTAALRNLRPPANITLSTGMVSAFDQHASPGHVLADFVANMSLPHLQRKISLEHLSGQLTRSFLIPNSTGSPPRPHIASGTITSSLLDEHIAGGSSARKLEGAFQAKAGGLLRPWSVEQAQVWLSQSQGGAS